MIDIAYTKKTAHTRGREAAGHQWQSRFQFATVPAFHSDSARHDQQPTTQYPNLISFTSTSTTGRGYSMSLATLIVLSAIHIGEGMQAEHIDSDQYRSICGFVLFDVVPLY